MSILTRLSTWHRHRRRSFQYLEVLAGTRERGLWPPARSGSWSFPGSRVLVVRRDRLGDMMLSLPFLERLLASGAAVRVLATDPLSRALLAASEVTVVAEGAEARDWQPELLLFLEPCRHLRATRHPERWAFVEETLGTFPGVPATTPGMRSPETLSFFAGPYCRPFEELSALSLLDRFADGLGLPRTADRLFGSWICGPTERQRGSVVLNLSAGSPSTSDRRDVPLELWSRIHDTLSAGAPTTMPTSALVQPGDDLLRDGFREAREAGRFGGCELHCFPDIVDAARWLGSQRLVISPETGLCHLARSLDVPMVVLTPERQVPYWYPPQPGTRCVFAEWLRDTDPDAVVRATRDLL